MSINKNKQIRAAGMPQDGSLEPSTPKKFAADFQRAMHDANRQAGNVQRQAIRAVADIPPEVAHVARAVGIGLAAGTAAAFAAPVIAGAGIVGAGALAVSATVGAVAAVTAGEAIDRADRAIHEQVKEKGNFENNSPVADAVTGASLGLNIQAMSMAHGAIEAGAAVVGSRLAAIPAISPTVASGLGKVADIGMHAGLHLAVDTGIESANQLAQSALRREAPQKAARRVGNAVAGTVGPSIGSTLVVEAVESKLPGSRPALMSVMEGLEAATRQGGVSAAQLRSDAPATVPPSRQGPAAVVKRGGEAPTGASRGKVAPAKPLPSQPEPAQPRWYPR